MGAEVGEREARLELRVSGDSGNLTLEVSREVGGGRVWASDIGRRLQMEWVIKKVVNRYSGTVVSIVTFDTNGRRWGFKEVYRVEIGDRDGGGAKNGVQDKHKQGILKWKNGVGERIEQKLANIYKKMGCIVVVECYSLRLGEYSVELTNNLKANLSVYDYVHSIYKTATQEIIHNQLVHQIEAHDKGIVDGKTGQVVGWDDIDDDYDRCILLPTNGRQPRRPLSKRRESQMQGTKSRRCSKCDKVGHIRRTCRNPRANFDASYKGDVV
ncbi:hypothetical protein Cgig2_024086 [Carnegiea gigantea]|uniref:CCHC-type domain-containing protein n=1 Tax=Carnegiea gigantea TaxID=171969 RepID=A0A9Q1K6X7_9CARY|nr:hypothetical protein Cgig2_024086 [Carnegiea gigantea]